MRELILNIATVPHPAFLQDGFSSALSTPRLHKHNYAEIHIVTGEMTIKLTNNEQRLPAYSAAIIPSGCYHRIILSECARRISFQVAIECRDFSLISLERGMTDALFAEVDRASKGGNFAATASYLSLVTAALAGVRYEGEGLSDYSFRIREFFSRRYGEEVRLSDLAGELHLSERQTERLVREHTGHSFREELTATRLDIAEQLIDGGGLSMGEIASYVGYKSYAGFFKARMKFKDMH